METETRSQLPLCACGCGQPVTAPTRRWIKGHDKVKPELHVEKLCACGCGQPVRTVHQDWVHGHHMRCREPQPKQPRPLCACGCGEPVARPTSQYKRGHSTKGRSDFPQQPCACGCGELAPKYHRYVYKHGNRGRRPWNVKDEPMPLCACGCGTPVKRRNYRYVAGHSARMVSPEELRRRFGEDGHKGYAHDDHAKAVMRKRKFENPVIQPPTECEALVQQALIAAGIPFLFNTPVEEICQPDFSFPVARIVLQIDGSTHQTPAGRERDARQDVQLSAAGWEVVRWTNARVRSSLPRLMEAFQELYASRLSCQGSVRPAPADEPRV